MAVGVKVTTQVRSGPTTEDAPRGARFFMPTLAERGPIERAIRSRSLAEWEATFGGAVPYSQGWHQARMYFEEGGAELYTVRVVGEDAEVGLDTVNDRAVAPLPSVDVYASSPGSWSSQVAYQFVAGADPGTVALRVFFNGKRTKTYDRLATPAAIASAVDKDPYLRAAPAGSTTPAPGNLPALMAQPVALPAGTDDRATVDAPAMASALARFGKELGEGRVAIPGYTAEQVGAELMLHGEATDREAILATAEDADKASAEATADNLIGSDASEYGGLFWPWLTIPVTGGATRTVSPEGYVAAVAARARRIGPGVVPAGVGSVARFVTGPVVEVTADEGDELDEANVNVIRVISDTTRLYGWRSLSTDEDNFALLSGRALLNYLSVEARARCEDHVFDPLDQAGGFARKVETTLIGLVEPLRVQGLIYPSVDEAGNMLDPGYSVSVDTSRAIAAQNKATAVLAARPSPVGTLIEVTVIKAAVTASV
jgi:hypothetical protein